MPHRSLTAEERDALLALGSLGSGAQIDPSAISGLIDAGMVEANGGRLVLTVRGEMAYAYLTDRPDQAQR